MNNKGGISLQAINELFMELWENHRGKVLGVIIGLLFGVLVLALGFWRLLFISLCILVGYLIGTMADERYDFRGMFQRIIKRR